MLEANEWLTQDATSDNYNEGLIGRGLEPGCDYYMDAALRGYNGGPFSKVHVMVDLKCEGDSIASREQYSLDHGDEPSDPRGCESTNPCLLALMDTLPDDMLVLR